MTVKKTPQVATIRSLDRGLAILQAIASTDQAMSLGEVASMMGIDRSTAFRLLHTLKRRGFLAMPAGRKDYILGSTIWVLHNHYDWSKMLVKIASDHLKELAAQTNETAHVAIREGAQALFLDCAAASHMVAVSSRIGELLPIHCTAHGKALMADANVRDLKALYGGRTLKKFTPSTLTSIAQLASDIATIRERGYALDDAEFSADLRCIAAPIRLKEEIIGSIGISAPLLRVTAESTRANGEQCARIAASISDMLTRMQDKE
jgi:DNA-binding IclR family transcriptional regulator